MKQITEPFEELIIPRKELHDSSAVVYRVYSNSRNFELVEAVSALDALAQSKIKNVYKVKRHDPLGDNVIHLNQVIKEEPVVENEPQIQVAPALVIEQIAELATEEPQPEAIMEIAVEPEVESPPVAVEAAPLSNDDIDKLLNS